MDPATDVSGCIIDTEQDLGESSYRIGLRCPGAYKLDRSAEIVCTISGSHNRRLRVTVNDVIYYNKRLPAEAIPGCTHGVKFGSKEDLLTVMVKKREPAMWLT